MVKQEINIIFKCERSLCVCHLPITFARLTAEPIFINVGKEIDGTLEKDMG